MKDAPGEFLPKNRFRELDRRLQLGARRRNFLRVA